MPFPPELWLACAAIVLFGYIVLGLGGFGSSLVSMPLLALLLPIKMVVPLMLMLDFVGMLTNGVRLRHDVDRGEVRAMVPPLLAGMALGVATLVVLPARALLFVLGVFILAYGVYTLNPRPERRPVGRGWSLPAGLFGGLIGGMFGTGGAVFAMYFMARIPDMGRMRATMSAVFVVSTGTRLILFLVSGLLLQREVWLAFAGLVPLVFAGLYIGHRLHGRLTRMQVARLLSLLLLGSGVSVLVKALG
ncbi:MAG: sulfite exporter TauE/SafE family protein [Burkholderiales bacterium]|nr:sulfite exporter TauE/SafE family protein [Burkholderiales bacterium]